VLGLFLWQWVPLEEVLRRPGLARLPRGPGHSGWPGIELMVKALSMPGMARH